MRTVIIAGGAVRDYGYIRSFIGAGDLIVCADRGYRHAERMGLAVDMLVGDMDSIGEVPGGVPTLRADAHKDQTDTELAVEYARGRGAGDFLYLAATGSRQDHSLTNILALINHLSRGERATLIDDNNIIMPMGRHMALPYPAGTIVSLIPVTPCHGVTTENLAYPLSRATLSPGVGLSVSNVIEKSPAVVSMEAGGAMLIIIARD